ncbi:hypothetical protein PVAP13_9NG461014 [Panicum virgatum]|uniref:Uncharacterized protein n=1 Tax=Panicum virgatum TaxID=38727 RepID=A0A8T0MRL4_PANVG|nr:hypothetical protein PVAP13_9NG461014 [Panicum virgatum]
MTIDMKKECTRVLLGLASPLSVPMPLLPRLSPSELLLSPSMPSMLMYALSRSSPTAAPPEVAPWASATAAAAAESSGTRRRCGTGGAPCAPAPWSRCPRMRRRGAGSGSWAPRAGASAVAPAAFSGAAAAEAAWAPGRGGGAPPAHPVRGAHAGLGAVATAADPTVWRARWLVRMRWRGGAARSGFVSRGALYAV